MAKLSSDGKYVTVERGDTLSGIAVKYCGSYNKYKQLAAINNISNPNLIYVGQKIYLTSSGSSSSGSSSKNTSTTASKATVDHFGLLSNTDNNTLFATWTWNRSDTANYEVWWEYITAEGVWFVGNNSTVENKQSTYSIPTNAKRVKFWVRPISKTHTVNNKETKYWTASWSDPKNYDLSNKPPEKPSAPTVKIDKYKLTAELENLDVNGTDIQFQIYKNDSTIFKTGNAKITPTNSASFSCDVDAGGRYKVRCRAFKYKIYGEWSEFSSEVSTIPSTPSGFTVCKANSETSVYLEWSAENTAKTYDIEYTTKITYFDGSDRTTIVNGIETTHYEKTGLETGEEYFFRLRATNTNGSSGWSEIKSVVIGKKPAAPTTWSSTTIAVTGENLTLYWVHNSGDGSSQTFAELELYIDGLKETYTIENTRSEETKDKTSSYSINTATYVDGTKIQWRVRTAGITKVYGDWSVQRTIDIYAPPTLELNIKDSEGNAIDTLEKFPFYISGLAGPKTQAPISYHLSIIANETYETNDNIGNIKTVKDGEEVYSKYFDTKEPLLVEFLPSNIDLESAISYTAKCVVSMNSGLNAESSLNFTVSWIDVEYEPNAEISIDEDTVAAYIKPFCTSGKLKYYKVNTNNEVTTETIDSVFGEPLKGRFTKTGEQMYSGMTADGETVTYCVIEEKSIVEGVSLSVYRREFDGTFTEIATRLPNEKGTFVTDPHPALDYARYRIVATTDSTGAVSFYDIPAYPVGEKAIIIQWDEQWSNFDSENEDTLSDPPWAGSLLRLPYNIDVSDKHSSDVSLVEYIGRKHPVTYYGTQLGESSNWNVSIDKRDEETLYALRRLAIWMGDVYVREPSGSGYWATVSISFSQTHCEVTIPVSISLTRVEGGM